MKRILLSLMMVVATLLSATATEVVFDFTNPASLGYAAPSLGGGSVDIADGGTIKSGIITITCAQNGASNATRFWGGTSAIDLRAYTKSTFTISTTNGDNITNLAINGAKIAPDMLSFDSGSYNASGKDGAWTGSATTITITMLKTTNFNSFKFTTVSATGIATPVMSPKGGKFFEAQSVTLSCPTPNASIFYTLDGTEPSKASTSYSAPIAISKIGTTTLKAIAFVGADKSSIASETYEIAEPKTVANIAAFLATCPTEPATGEIVTINSPVTVLFHGVSKANSYLFVKDETGALQVFSAGKVFPQTYAQGNVIPAGIMGSVGFFGKAPQMVPALDSFLAPTGTIEVKPLRTPVEEVSADMLNQLVILYDVTLAETTISDATGAIEYYNRFDGVVIPTDLTAKYDVTGIVNSYNGKLQIYPTAINISGGVNDITNDETSIVANYGNINITVNEATTATIINGAGQVVGQQEVVAGENTIEVANGFYIVKVGNTVAKVIVK